MDAEKYKLENGLNIEADQHTAANRAMYRNRGKKGNTLDVGTDDLVDDGEDDDDDSDTYGTDSDFSDDRGGRKAYSPPSVQGDSDSDGDEETGPRVRSLKNPPPRKLGRSASKFDVGGKRRGRSRKKYKPKKRKSRRNLPKVDSGSDEEEEGNDDDDDSEYYDE